MLYKCSKNTCKTLLDLYYIIFGAYPLTPDQNCALMSIEHFLFYFYYSMHVIEPGQQEGRLIPSGLEILRET